MHCIVMNTHNETAVFSTVCADSCDPVCCTVLSTLAQIYQKCSSVVSYRRSYSQCCSMCYPLLLFIILAACVMACAGLIWMQIALKEDLDALKEKLHSSKIYCVFHLVIVIKKDPCSAIATLHSYVFSWL